MIISRIETSYVITELLGIIVILDDVYLFIRRDMHADLCGGKPGLCEAMRPASGAMLLRYLRSVNFTGL